MTTPYKIVNGVAVALTPADVAELAARDREWTTVEKPEQERGTARRRELADDIAVKDLSDRLTKATAAEIDAWFDANVMSVPQVVHALKAIAKVLALRL